MFIDLYEKHMNRLDKIQTKDGVNITSKHFVDGIDFLSDNILYSNLMKDIAKIKFYVTDSSGKPSESNANKQTIKVSNAIFKETQNGTKVDDAAWIVHEICHDLGTNIFHGDYMQLTNPVCLRIVLKSYKVKSMNELHNKLIELLGKDGIGYPTSDVELFTFLMQFKFLKEVKNKTNDDILKLMEDSYGAERYSFIEAGFKFILKHC